MVRFGVGGLGCFADSWIWDGMEWKDDGEGRVVLWG